MKWQVELTEGFSGWWSGLSAKEQGDVAACALLLSEWGPYPRFPHTAWINRSRHRNMREMRIRSCGHTVRLLYAFDARRLAIVLVGGEKGSRQERDPQCISRADRIYDGHLRALEAAEAPL